MHRIFLLAGAIWILVEVGSRLFRARRVMDEDGNVIVHHRDGGVTVLHSRKFLRKQAAQLRQFEKDLLDDDKR